MEHYLPILNTVMCIFQSGLYLENCFNFKRDDDSLQSRSILHCAIIPERLNKTCAHRIVILEVGGKIRIAKTVATWNIFLIVRGLIRFYLWVQTLAC